MKINFIRIFLFINFFLASLSYSGILTDFQYRKIDPALARLVNNPDLRLLIFRQTLGKVAVGQVKINVLIKSSLSRAELNALGISVYSKIGDIYSASIPIAGIAELAENHKIEYIQASKICATHNDLSMPEIGIPTIHNTYGFTGRGVIIGIVDTGIDWKHDDFRNSNGTTRIKYILDFSNPGDTNGDEILDGSGPFGGTLYTEQNINSALSGSGNINQNDVVGHGTHVAGSAAGNGRATGNSVPAKTYVGAAPEADLIIVKATRQPGSRNFDTIDYINAIAFIDSIALVLNKPYVINLSLGGSNGPHDGKDLSEQAIDHLVGDGKKGKAIVVSSGNDGNKAIHSGGTFSSSQNKYEINFSVPAYTPNTSNMDDYIIFEAWHGSAYNFSVKLQTPGNNLIGPINSGSDYGRDTSEGAVYISNALGGASALNGDKLIQIQIYDFTQTNVPKTGGWKVILEGSAGRYDLWLAGSTMDAYLTSSFDYTMIAGTPGTAFSAITVGSYITKNHWTDLNNNSLGLANLVIGEISDFSSPGPTRDGRIKPEICAPGEMIAASYSSDATPGTAFTMFNTGSVQFPNGFIARDGKHALSQGTSFAAPHVTGAIALLLQQNQSLDAIQIRQALLDSAKTDNYTASTPNNNWGYGKTNALGALRQIIGHPPQKNLSLSIFQNPALTQYIDFYLIAKNSLQSTPTASIKVANDPATDISMTRLENLLYKGEYVFSKDGIITLTVNATLQSGSSETLSKSFNVKLLKAGAGGTLNYENVKLDLPAHSFNHDSYFTVFTEMEFDSNAILKPLGKIIRLGPAQFSFNQPIELIVYYDQSLDLSIDESKLAIYKLTENEWVKLDGFVFEENNFIRTYISQLGTFAVFYNPQTNDQIAPENFQLYQNFPNPFNANTTIRFYHPVVADVTLKIFNVNGELIKTFELGVQDAGMKNISWDGKNDSRTVVASGIYFYNIIAGKYATTKKMLFIK